MVIEKGAKYGNKVSSGKIAINGVRISHTINNCIEPLIIGLEK